MNAEVPRRAARRPRAPVAATPALRSPKDLSVALLLKAATLAQTFDAMSAEEAARAHLQPATKRRIGDQVDAVMACVQAVAGITGADVAPASPRGRARQARPLQGSVSDAREAGIAEPMTHVLLDYENVQPTEAELADLVAQTGAVKVWAFHGPQQKGIAQRYPTYGDRLTVVPISRTGKNALDFHLSFYMGYIVSREPQAHIVVVANDKGYEPMLAHAREMGFSVRKVGHGGPASKRVRKTVAAVKKTAKLPAPASSARKKAPARVAVAKKATPVAPNAPVAKRATAKTSATKRARQTAEPPAKPPVKSAPRPSQVATQPPAPPRGRRPAAKAAPSQATGRAPGAPLPDGAAFTLTASLAERVTKNLHKMGGRRPVRLASLRSALKPLLGTAASDAAVSTVLEGLVGKGVVTLGPSGAVSYPLFDTPAART